MPTHPLLDRFDALAPEGLSSRERLVVMCLLRHGDWATASECAPSVATIARWCGITQRQVYRILDGLTCRAPVREGAAMVPCLRCESRDLLVRTREPGRYQPTVYAVHLGHSRQPMLPEVSGVGRGRRADVAVGVPQAGGRRSS